MHTEVELHFFHSGVNVSSEQFVKLCSSLICESHSSDRHLSAIFRF